MTRIARYHTEVNGHIYEIEIFKDGHMLINGEERTVDFHSLGPSVYSIITNHKSLLAIIGEESGARIEVLLSGKLYNTEVIDERAMLMEQRKGGRRSTSGEILSPMPGLIVLVSAETGQQVQEGETLVVLESMKMQNELKSPVSGMVSAIHCASGETVEKGALLVQIDTEAIND